MKQVREDTLGGNIIFLKSRQLHYKNPTLSETTSRDFDRIDDCPTINRIAERYGKMDAFYEILFLVTIAGWLISWYVVDKIGKLRKTKSFKPDRQI